MNFREIVLNWILKWINLCWISKIESIWNRIYLDLENSREHWGHFFRSTTRTYFQFLDLISNHKNKWKRFSFSSWSTRLGEKITILSRKNLQCAMFNVQCNGQRKMSWFCEEMPTFLGLQCHFDCSQCSPLFCILKKGIIFVREIFVFLPKFEGQEHNL